MTANNNALVYSEARGIYEDAYKTMGFHPVVYKNLLLIYRRLGLIKEAFRLIQNTISKFPEDPAYKIDLANIYLENSLYKEAINIYDMIKKKYKIANVYNNCGVAYRKIGEFLKAKESYEEGLRLEPENLGLMSNLGIAYKDLGEFDKSKELLEKVLKMQPKSSNAHANLGALYKSFFEYDLALKYYSNALKINPNHINANYDFGWILLYYGYYQEGFKHYEFRLKMEELKGKLARFMGIPMWMGENIRDRTILVQNEQGFGDNIMFSRYIDMLIPLAKKVIVRTRKELVTLFRSSFDGVEVISEEDDLPSFELFIPIASLPNRFATSKSSVPNRFPYIVSDLEVDSGVIDESKKNIALVFSSSQTNRDFKNKNFPPQRFFELEDKSIKLYSFQLDSAKDKISEAIENNKIIDMSKYIKDFRDSASYLKKFDYIVTCDTALAHLCGAINIEAFVLLPKFADWRWGAISDTPWYRSLRFFRQRRQGSWDEPIEEVVSHIKQLVGNL